MEILVSNIGLTLLPPQCTVHYTVHCTIHCEIECNVYCNVHCTVNYTINFTVHYYKQGSKWLADLAFLETLTSLPPISSTTHYIVSCKIHCKTHCTVY